VLDLDDQKTRKTWLDPFLIKGVSFLLLDPVVTVDMESLRVLALEATVGGLGAEVTEVAREVAVEDHQGIARVWMLVVAMRQEHVGTEEHRPPPELGQQLALNLDVLDVLGV